jgi:hypothetical protein
MTLKQKKPVLEWIRYMYDRTAKDLPWKPTIIHHSRQLKGFEALALPEIHKSVFVAYEKHVLYSIIRQMVRNALGCQDLNSFFCNIETISSRHIPELTSLLSLPSHMNVMRSIFDIFYKKIQTSFRTRTKESVNSPMQHAVLAFSFRIEDK